MTSLDCDATNSTTQYTPKKVTSLCNYSDLLQVLPLARQLSSMARPVETFSMAFVTAPNHETAKYSFSIVVPFTFQGCINYPRISQYGRFSNCLVFRSLASGLVSGKLAACVNILPGVTSVYEWEGKVVVVLLTRVVS